jgi:hypothetical protein
MSEDVKAYRQHLFDYARAFKLGSTESRAILTAIEHANIMTPTLCDRPDKSDDLQYPPQA